MKKRQHGLMYFVIIFFGLVAFSACIASEFKRSKAKDMKLDGMSCHLPISPAFVLGAFASTSLLSAQIIGNTLIFCSRGKNIIAWKQRIPFSLMILSW
ncbi:hypothetical protein IFM89_011979 [Coptis chinensis]|uniref:Uncharacterized protein n=1 Tax=Coptis chinensis TaxID=261450 RepID=A0A835LZZ0_9MAGN|nr:hypothetical protein IFM89_011979 [Coptis chinensis]